MKRAITEDIKRIKELMFQDEDPETEESIDDETYEEMTEEGEETSTSSSDAGASQNYPQVGKWESGAVRGPANPITSAKREDKVTRGKANQLK